MLLPSSVPSPAEAAATPAHAVRVTFAGPLRGWLAVRVTDDVARAVAENMLGTSDASTTLVRDALGEVANVVCGNLLPLLAGRDVLFRLGAPEPLDPRDGVWRAVADATPALAVSLGVDGGRVDLALQLNSESLG